MNAVDNFVKTPKERKCLVKSETFYELKSIKKLWRYVLRALIEYVTLDSRFDRVRTHHFILLNHFWHGVKISFSYYLFTSLCKALSSFKKKPFPNLALHEGLLFLVYEHFKALSISINPKQNVPSFNISGSSSFSSDSDDIQSISSEEDEISNLDKSGKGKVKLSPSGQTPCRKIPRGHGNKPSSQDEEDYNEEEEDMDTEEEENEKVNNSKEEKLDKKEKSEGKKWKREADSEEKKKKN